MKRLLATAAFTAGLAMFATGSVQATTIDFSAFSNPLGVSQAYGPITAFGFTSPTTANNPNVGPLSAHGLYYKNGGANETGLGLRGAEDGEIQSPAGSESIVLDVSALMGQDLKLGFGSVQTNEVWRVGFSSSATLPSNKTAFGRYVLGTTAYPNTYDFGVQNSRYLIVEADRGDILLTSFTYVPEPASMALIGAGLIGLGYYRRRTSRG